MHKIFTNLKGFLNFNFNSHSFILESGDGYTSGDFINDFGFGFHGQENGDGNMLDSFYGVGTGDVVFSFDTKEYHLYVEESNA